MATRLMLLFKAALLAALAFGFTGASAGAAQSNVLPVGQEWTLVSYQGTDGQTIDASGYGVTIMFGADSRVSGNGGCNGFGGSYSVGADGLLNISQVISTKRACADETRTQFESRYFAALEQANDYLADTNQLEVMFAKSAGRLIFAKSGSTGAALPQAVTAGTWTLTGYQDADVQSSDVRRYNITIKFSADGKISGFGGCNGYGGVYKTGANEDLTLSEIISTLIACEEDNKTQWESRYFAALQTVSQYSINGNTLQLQFDNGAGLLTFAPGTGSSTGNTPGMPITGAGETPIWPIVLGAALLVALGGLALRSRATRLARREI